MYLFANRTEKRAHTSTNLDGLGGEAAADVGNNLAFHVLGDGEAVKDLFGVPVRARKH